MRLSEAIRLGALLAPQAHGAFVGTVIPNGYVVQLFGGHYVCGERVTGTCALGAALDAIGQLTSHEPYDCARAATHEWPILLRAVTNPAFGPASRFTSEMLFVIERLNDIHHWTREQIADWVETVEREREALTSAAQPAEATR